MKVKIKQEQELNDFEAIQLLSQNDNFNNNQNYVLSEKKKKGMGEYINEFNFKEYSFFRIKDRIFYIKKGFLKK